MQKVRTWLPQTPDELKPTPERAFEFIDTQRTITKAPGSTRFLGLPPAELKRLVKKATDPVEVRDLQIALEAVGDDTARSIDLVGAVMAHPRAKQGADRYADAYRTVRSFKGTLEAIRTGGIDEGDVAASRDEVWKHKAAGERGYVVTQSDGTVKWVPEGEQPAGFMRARDMWSFTPMRGRKEEDHATQLASNLGRRCRVRGRRDEVSGRCIRH